MYIDTGHWFESKIFHEHSRYYKGTFWKIQSLGPDKIQFTLDKVALEIPMATLPSLSS